MAQLGRNQLCPCGSGKKYKNYCLRRGVIIPDNISSVVVDRATGAPSSSGTSS